MNEHPVSMETLNVVQQVLRGALLAIAGTLQADPARVARYMEAFAQRSPPIDSRAQTMLLDLAAGFAALADDPRH